MKKRYLLVMEEEVMKAIKILAVKNDTTSSILVEEVLWDFLTKEGEKK